MLNAEAKAQIVTKFQRQKGDVGSPEVQIALLSARIRDLQDHFTENKKDLHSRRGLMKLVEQRRKLMKYLRAENLDRYRFVVKECELRG